MTAGDAGRLKGVIRDALAYPLRRHNALILGIGVLVACLPPILYRLLPTVQGAGQYIMLIGLIFECAVLCLLLVFFHSILETSTKGDERAPEWPEVADLQALAGRAFHVIIPLVVSFLPLLGFFVTRRLMGRVDMPPGVLWLSCGLFALGLFYLPMALLVHSFYGETAVVNVVGVARSIGRTWRDYMKVVGMMLLLGAVTLFLTAEVAAFPAFLAYPVTAALQFYFLAATMRAVGLIYARNRERLGWEPQKVVGPEPSAVSSADKTAGR